MQHLHACDRREHFHRQVQRAADAGGAVAHAVGFGLGDRKKLGERRGRVPGVHHIDDRRDRDHRDRGEVFRGIVGWHLLQHRKDRVGRYQQGVAVRCRLDGGVDADLRAGAGPVVDHHRLADARREFVGDRACDRVGGAARGGGDDDLDRLRGPGLGIGRGSGECGCNCERNGCELQARCAAGECSFHRVPPPVSPARIIAAGVRRVPLLLRRSQHAARYSAFTPARVTTCFQRTCSSAISRPSDSGVPGDASAPC